MAISRKSKTKKPSTSRVSKTKSGAKASPPGQKKTKARPATSKKAAAKPKTESKSKAKAAPGLKAATKPKAAPKAAAKPKAPPKSKAAPKPKAPPKSKAPLKPTAVPQDKAKAKGKKSAADVQSGASLQKAKPPIPAMPKKVPAKPKRYKPAIDSDMRRKLREALVAQRQRLLRLVQTAKAQMAQKSGDLADISDRASEGYGDELAVGLMAIEAAQLDDIENALRRIADHTYGLCVDCGKPIPRKRLEVLPFAKSCLVCTGQKERGVRFSGDHLDGDD